MWLFKSFALPKPMVWYWFYIVFYELCDTECPQLHNSNSRAILIYIIWESVFFPSEVPLISVKWRLTLKSLRKSEHYKWGSRREKRLRNIFRTTQTGKFSVNFFICDFLYSRKNQSECLSRIKRQHKALYKCGKGCFGWNRNFIYFPSDFRSLPGFDSSVAAIK